MAIRLPTPIQMDKPAINNRPAACRRCTHFPLFYINHISQSAPCPATSAPLLLSKINNRPFETVCATSARRPNHIFHPPGFVHPSRRAQVASVSNHIFNSRLALYKLILRPRRRRRRCHHRRSILLQVSASFSVWLLRRVSDVAIVVVVVVRVV